MDNLLQKARFNAKAKFGSLRKAVMEYVDLAQFVIFRGAEDYDELKVQVKAFDAKKVMGSHVLFMSLPKRIFQNSRLSGDSFAQGLTSKVDKLSEQFAELSLILKSLRRSEKIKIEPVLIVGSPVIMHPRATKTYTVSQVALDVESYVTH